MRPRSPCPRPSRSARWPPSTRVLAGFAVRLLRSGRSRGRVRLLRRRRAALAACTPASTSRRRRSPRWPLPSPPPGLPELAARAPLAGVGLVAGCCGVGVRRLARPDVPAAGGAGLPPGPGGGVTDRLVAAASRLLERRTSRRGVLIRIAIGGSALAVAPLRYLLRPGSAMAVITCRNCHPRRALLRRLDRVLLHHQRRQQHLPPVHVHGRLVEVHQLHGHEAVRIARACATTSTATACRGAAARTAARARRVPASTGRPVATCSGTASATPRCTG